MMENDSGLRSPAVIVEREGIPISNATRASTRRTALNAVLIVALVFIAFFPALSADFVHWDDDRNFLENPSYRGLSLAHLEWMATTFQGGPYQPLAWLTLAIDHALWGMDARGYHFTNVLLHACGAVAFYFLARRLFALGSSALREKSLELASLAAALFFALHPLRAESVAWVTERRDVLSGVFFVLATSAYLRFAASSSDIERRRWRVLSLALLFVGLLAKASGMMLPFVFVALDRWPLRKSWRTSLTDALPFALVVLPFAALALWGQASQPHAMATIASEGVVARVAQASYAAVFYPAKTVLPIDLSPIYDLPVPFDPFAARFVIAMAGACVVTVALFAGHRRLPAAWTAWFAFLAILAPTSGLVQVGPQLVADRYSYLACMPFALLAAGALFSFAPRAAPATSVIVLAIALPLTWRATRTWHDSVTLWENAIASEPKSYVAHANLGAELMALGREKEAREHYVRALEIDPKYALANNNLGQLLLRDGRIDEAIEHFRAAIDARYEYPLAHINLGVALMQRGDVETAEHELRVALELRPDAGSARVNLGNVLLARGKTNEALDEYTRALAIDPNNPDAHADIANVLAQQGRAKLAIEHYRAALASRPAWPETEIALAWILATHKNAALRDGAGAVALAEDAIARTPSPSARSLDTLAAAYAAVGRFDDARVVARRALGVSRDASLSTAIELRLSLYEAGRPYVGGER